MRSVLAVISISVVLLLFAGPTASAAADIDELVFRGADFHYRGQLDRAIATFRQVLAGDPQNEFARNQLGLLFAKKGVYDQAFREFEAVVRMNADNTFARLWIGILYMRRGETGRAVKTFQALLDKDPENADAYYFLGTIYYVQHNPAKAIAFLKKARDADSDEADTHYRLGKAFHNIDMTYNALLEYHRALAIKPTYTRAINEIGWIHYNRGDPDAAIAQWKASLKINPKDRDSVQNLAKVYNDLAGSAKEQGKVSEAVQFWRETLKVDPGNKAAAYYLKKSGRR